ncbi:MAG TPA: DUF1629 domain-containing protein [Archangium sp.]|nr:DUF1629 domain-containing protein [Archangium sp.]
MSSQIPVVWDWNVGKSFCVLAGIENVEKLYQLSQGVSRSQGFPKEACFRMDPSHPKYVALSDNIANLDKALVVSRKLKEFLESKGPRDVEYLRVSIFNHKKKLASDEYFIVNPLRVIDCVDKDKSDIEWNNIDPEKISFCFKLVLRTEALDDSLLLFRPRHLATRVMVHPELAKAIEGAGFTGLRFTEVDEFES